MKSQGKGLQSFIGLTLLLCCGIIAANAQTPEQIAQNALRSTVVLNMQLTDSNNSQGSGFFIADGLLVTNHHVIEGATSGTAKLAGTEQPYDIEGYVALDKDHDLAILIVSNLHAPPLPLGDSDTVRIGEIVYTVGNPRGLEGTFSDGIISNIQPDGHSGIEGKAIQMTAPISQGSSGGAVLNSKGEVIGIAASIRKDGQNLNFAIPVNYLKTLLKQAGPLKPLAATPSTSGNGVFSTLLSLVILSLTVFGVVHFLPQVKVDSRSTTVYVALGLAGLKTLLTILVIHMSFLSGIGSFLTENPPIDVIHAIGCDNCFQEKIVHALGCPTHFHDLLFSVVKFPAYLVVTAFLLGIASKVVPGFELNGFFNTFLVALLVVIGESLLHSVIPFT